MFAKCPSCLEERDIDEQKSLLQAEAAFVVQRAEGRQPGEFGYPLLDGFRRLAAEGHARWFWACDGCVESGKALASNVAVQNVATGTPFAAYVTRAFTCEDCDAASTFSPEEQRLWYEDYGFLIWSHPKRCQACRRARRDEKATHQKLADALAHLDATSASALDEIAELYGALGSAKAEEYRRRASNLRGR